MKRNYKKNNTSYIDWVTNNWERNNIFPPPLDPQDAINFLVDYLLGEDWYSTIPGNSLTINTEIVDAILTKYSKRYRKEKKIKENKEIRMELNKDFYDDLPGMVCIMLDELIDEYKNEDWFMDAWEEYRTHILNSSMDDAKMPGYVFGKYIKDDEKQGE